MISEPNPSPQTSVAPTGVPLSDLRRGECGRVCCNQLCREECELLRAMGLSEDVVIRVCQRGKPYVVQVQATRLGLSPSMARQILVDRIQPTP